MPLYDYAKEAIRTNLLAIQSGYRAPLIAIGFFTETQFERLNIFRMSFDLHLLEQNEIVFVGRHLFTSRTKDGYTVEDMIAQIESALTENAIVDISKNWSRIDNPLVRADGYGNLLMIVGSLK